MVTVGGSPVKTWSTRQSTVALSVGEAEYHAVVKAAAEGIAVQSIAGDLGWRMSLELSLDSSTAQAIASRNGIGKVRHMEVRFLWLQDLVGRKAVKLNKVPGDLNPADLLTKPLGHTNVARLLHAVGVKFPRDSKECPSFWNGPRAQECGARGGVELLALYP